MEQLCSLLLITSFLLTMQTVNFAMAKGKGIGRDQKAVKIRGSPIFCADKFKKCIGRPVRLPYQTSATACERRLERKYFCNKGQIYRNFTDSERSRYYSPNRSMGTGQDFSFVDLSQTLESTNNSASDNTQNKSRNPF